MLPYNKQPRRPRSDLCVLVSQDVYLIPKVSSMGRGQLDSPNVTGRVPGEMVSGGPQGQKPHATRALDFASISRDFASRRQQPQQTPQPTPRPQGPPRPPGPRQPSPAPRPRAPLVPPRRRAVMLPMSQMGPRASLMPPGQAPRRTGPRSWETAANCETRLAAPRGRPASPQPPAPTPQRPAARLGILMTFPSFRTPLAAAGGSERGPHSTSSGARRVTPRRASAANSDSKLLGGLGLARVTLHPGFTRFTLGLREGYVRLRLGCTRVTPGLKPGLRRQG